MKKTTSTFLQRGFLLGILFALMGFQHLHAQNTVTGTITDENDQPVPGANIVVQGTTNGTQTDFDGNFTIEVTPEDVLVISYLGYITQNITIGNQTIIDVKLQTDQQQLDEVVVIGYGTSKKSDVTGAVTQVTAKSFENQPLTRVEDALQGRAAGVTVAGSGQPGDGMKVRIRGVNSITGDNDPLVVVDGVFGGDLRTLNPNDIQSIEVLKDASALAIYGSRGSNGVILVTTKKGSGKAKIFIDQFVTYATVEKRLETLS
ncbi:MAG: TonB-dependent receptor plug domain-containing protein, partial [Maribacter sp.]|uniref:TonB-dependent receptor plug domain-containing protein n=1 Tax=Maribacter sp. TaxID=1897614 RepID=UPI003C775B93